MVHLDRADSDEAAFSDVSSVCAEDSASASTSARSNTNECRWLGRAEMARRWQERQEAKRKQIEDIRKKAEEQALLQKKAFEERSQLIANGDDETVSEAGSGFSDISNKDDAVEANGQVEGPDPSLLHPDSDEEAPVPKPAALEDGSDFGDSSSDEGEGAQDSALPELVTIASACDDSDRVQLLIKVAADGPPRYVVVRLRPDWAPLATKRFLELVEAGFYDDARFHRVLEGTLAQFGLPADPALYERWRTRILEDEGAEVAKVSNSRCTLSFATKGPGTRCCQVFVNLCHNKSFDYQGCTPFAEIVRGMDVADELFNGYGEAHPKGTGPDPDRIKEKGLAYLREWPKLSYIERAEVLSRSGDIITRSSFRAKTLESRASGVGTPSSRESTKRVSFHSSAEELGLVDQSARTRSKSPPADPRSSSPLGCAGSGLSAAKLLKSDG